MTSSLLSQDGTTKSIINAAPTQFEDETLATGLASVNLQQVEDSGTLSSPCSPQTHSQNSDEEEGVGYDSDSSEEDSMGYWYAMRDYAAEREEEINNDNDLLLHHWFNWDDEADDSGYESGEEEDNDDEEEDEDFSWMFDGGPMIAAY